MTKRLRVLLPCLPASWVIAALTAAATLLAPVNESSAAEATALAAARASIQAGDLEKHEQFLAGDTLEGRLAGSSGGRAAGTYIAKLLESYGMQPAGKDGGYFQTFNGQLRNILAMIPGDDPALKNEIVLVSAHYDHVGYGSRQTSRGPIGYIHNGADDNASGTSGLLETIEAFSTLTAPPRRTIVFAFWDGEEQGLLGSRHWVAHPTLPLNRVKLMINADMIGRLLPSGLIVYGSRTSPGSREFVSRLNAEADLPLDFDWELKQNSDHWPFFEKRVPVVMFHTGLHKDYHRPSDDVERLNVAGMERISRLLFNTVSAAADADELFQYRGEAQRETSEQGKLAERPLPPLPSRFGIQWLEPKEGEQGVVIDRVFPQTAASRAGLVRGDRLLAFNGEPIEGSDHLRRLVCTGRNPITLRVLRAESVRAAAASNATASAPASFPAADSASSETTSTASDSSASDVSVGSESSTASTPEPVDLPLMLDGSPSSVGITWRVDPTEPRVVILTRVLSGSPAESCGLLPGDRLLSINGQRFADGPAFQTMVTTLPAPLMLEYERRGRVSAVELHPVREQLAQ